MHLRVGKQLVSRLHETVSPLVQVISNIAHGRCQRIGIVVRGMHKVYVAV